MRLIETVGDMRAAVKTQKMQGRSVGLVPTMGSLHKGHLSLVKASKLDNDHTVVSIFVNPKQFGANEDFKRYPRDLEKDSSLAEEAGADVVFAPGVGEMYPEGFNTYVNVEGITGILCGKSRPVLFRGVTTVVSKLFNIIGPDKAYFGQKDAQQVVVVRKMVKDLNMNVEIITCPTVREPDGLAMSSRNVYLSPEERKAATILSRALFEAEEAVKKGERSKEKILSLLFQRVLSEKLAVIDYIEAVDAETLQDVKLLKGKVLLVLAVKFGATRLIDNIILDI